MMIIIIIIMTWLNSIFPVVFELYVYLASQIIIKKSLFIAVFWQEYKLGHKSLEHEHMGASKTV